MHGIFKKAIGYGFGLGLMVSGSVAVVLASSIHDHTKSNDLAIVGTVLLAVSAGLLAYTRCCVGNGIPAAQQPLLPHHYDRRGATLAG